MYSLTIRRTIEDILFLLFLIIFSGLLVSFYFHAQTINTGYTDWIVHAFRIKSIQQYGLLSWTHTWANGISLWRSYQFIPHLLTLGLLAIFPMSVSRAMVVMTIILFIFLRVSIYAVLRLLHFSPLTSFVSSILSYDISQYWGGVSDYSLMFGFVFFPLVIFLWTQYVEGKIRYLFPYIVGLLFYIHPILGYSSVLLWFISIVFLDRKILSISYGIQFLIFLASSSLFWFPIAVKTSYIYTSTNYANRYFLNLVLSGYDYFGLSQFLLICLFLLAVWLFIPSLKQFKWANILSIFSLIYFCFIVIGLTVDIPEAIAQFQFTRAVTLVGIAIVMAFARVTQSAEKIKSRAIKAVLFSLLAVVVIEGVWYSSKYSPQPAQNNAEEMSAYVNTYGKKDLTNAKIWSSDIGLTSYYSPVPVQLPYSYMGQSDPNPISPRVSPLILYQPYADTIPLANINRLSDYFKITGTKYLLFDVASPFTNTLLSSGNGEYKDLGVVTEGNSSYHIFESVWQIKNAVAIDKKDVQFLKPFPTNLHLEQVQDQITLDEYVKSFTTKLYQPENLALNITYPTPDSLIVSIPNNLKTNNIYINESYDKDWKGILNKKFVTIQPAGPNFMHVILPSNLHTGGQLILQHYWPLSFYISIYLIFLIPIELMFVQCAKALQKK